MQAVYKKLRKGHYNNSITSAKLKMLILLVDLIFCDTEKVFCLFRVIFVYYSFMTKTLANI